MFTDPTDGAFDMSRFIKTRTGFVPILAPVTDREWTGNSKIGGLIPYLEYDSRDNFFTPGRGLHGKAADGFEALQDAETVWNAGGGFRYLTAREFGLQMGVDVARGPEQWAIYVVFGNSWN